MSNAKHMYDYFNDARHDLPISLTVNDVTRNQVLQILAVIIELEQMEPGV